jgi:putative membrane protein
MRPSAVVYDFAMSHRLDTLLKSAVLAASGLMLYEKISSGALAFYINKRFEWLVFAGVLLYLMLALTLAWRLLQRMTPVAALTARVTSWTSVLLLALPALIGFIAPARPLGASAIASRGIGLQSAPGGPGGAGRLQQAASGPRNILDWLRLIGSTADPAELAGQQADVTGFVYKNDPRFAAGQFMVSRFTVSCCVADAAAIGLIVDTDQLDQFEQDKWVRVVGRFTVGEFGGEKIPLIAAASIESVEQPDQPYLYP